MHLIQYVCVFFLFITHLLTDANLFYGATYSPEKSVSECEAKQ